MTPPAASDATAKCTVPLVCVFARITFCAMPVANAKGQQRWQRRGGVMQCCGMQVHLLALEGGGSQTSSRAARGGLAGRSAAARVTVGGVTSPIRVLFGAASIQRRLLVGQLSLGSSLSYPLTAWEPSQGV